jgi:hypothetical protein
MSQILKFKKKRRYLEKYYVPFLGLRCQPCMARVSVLVCTAVEIHILQIKTLTKSACNVFRRKSDSL